MRKKGIHISFFFEGVKSRTWIVVIALILVAFGIGGFLVFGGKEELGLTPAQKSEFETAVRAWNESGQHDVKWIELLSGYDLEVGLKICDSSLVHFGKGPIGEPLCYKSLALDNPDLAGEICGHLADESKRARCADKFPILID